MKLTRNERAQIRYQLYRDSGYSVQEARKLRYKGYIKLKGIKVDRKTGEVIKGKPFRTDKKTGQILKGGRLSAYQKTLRGVNIDNYMNDLRKVKNDSVFTDHGFLAKDRRYSGKYSEIVRAIRSNTRTASDKTLSNDQAWYFAYYMLQSKQDYETTRNELLSKQDFEDYDENKKKRNALKQQRYRARKKANKAK